MQTEGASDPQSGPRPVRRRLRVRLFLLLLLVIVPTSLAGAYHTTGLPVGSVRVFRVSAGIELNSSPLDPGGIFPASPTIPLEHCPTAVLAGSDLVVYGRLLPSGTDVVVLTVYAAFPTGRTGESRWDVISHGARMSVPAGFDTSQEVYKLWNDNGPKTSKSPLEFQYGVADRFDGNRPYVAFENHSVEDLGTKTVLARPGFLCA